MNILSIENAKTSKGERLGYLTGIIYMLPDNRTCPLASKAGCLQACLVHAGYASIYKSVNESRQARREMFYNERDLFFKQLDKEIKSFLRKAGREKMTPVIRLNGTSDIMYENIPYLGYKNIFEAYPNLQFYDYTKIAARLSRDLPKNYDLTFSYSGTSSYRDSVNKALKSKNRIAVVFKNGLPKEYMGRKVIDGDNTDLRFLDSDNVIVGLKAKGPAKTSNSDFIVDTLGIQ